MINLENNRKKSKNYLRSIWVSFLFYLKKQKIKNKVIRDSNKIDVVIPTLLENEKLLEIVLHSLNNITHTINNIYIVAPETDTVIFFCKKNKCIFINEDTVLGYKKDSIKYIVNNKNRNGWVFQQLLKLSADNFVQSENYLILDSDTVLIDKHSFIKNDKFIFQQTTKEFHAPYYKTFKKIFGYKTINILSCVCHMMIFNKNKIREMKKEIEIYNKKKWDSVIIDYCDPKEASFFSEYETYSNWMAIHYPENIKFIPFFNKPLKINYLYSLEKITEKYGNKYNSLSFHEYLNH